MTMAIRSPARNADHVYHAARLTTRQLAQIPCSSNKMTARSSLLSPRNGQRKSTGMLRPRNRSTSRLAPACMRHPRRSNPHS